jgi:uncharacterized protein (TIGR00369 family)
MENRLNLDSQLAEAIANCEAGWTNSDAGAPTPLDVTATEAPLGNEPAEVPAPIGKLLGLKLLHSEHGTAVVEFLADERYANPAGTLHGGVLCDIADAPMGLAYFSTLTANESMTTVELNINFLRPVWNATLRAKAKVVRAGNLVGLIECDVVDEQERLVARASSTCLTLRGRLADGRRIPPFAMPGSAATRQSR